MFLFAAVQDERTALQPSVDLIPILKATNELFVLMNAEEEFKHVFKGVHSILVKLIGTNKSQQHFQVYIHLLAVTKLTVMFMIFCFFLQIQLSPAGEKKGSTSKIKFSILWTAEPKQHIRYARKNSND